MEVDLHVHTIYSDGSDSPGEIVIKAKEAGLAAVAITDHDTIEGIEPALTAGNQHNLEIIPGIELGAEYLGQEVHILGYLIDIHNQEFMEKLAFIQNGRDLRMKNMVTRLQNLGFPVNLDQVKAITGKGITGRPHLAAAMVETGMVKTVSEAFELYIGHGRPAYLPRLKFTPTDAVHLIRVCGGVAVLAHPGLLNNQSLLEKLLDELIKAGIIGLEAHHPAHSKEMSGYYERLALEKGLIATGGSDYHGPERYTEGSLGLITVPYSVIEALKEKKHSYKKGV